LFEIPKPLATLGVGVDAIPEYILKANFFTGNELGMLGNIEEIPFNNQANSSDNLKDLQQKLQQARVALSQQKVNEAWNILLS
jgi:hypothetical protein